MDWLWGFVGGLMIGGAAAVFLLFNGRVMGASGIIGELVDRSGWSNWAERFAFLAGWVGVPYLLSRLIGGATHLTDNWLVIVLAGVLVGVGTRLANGCTSGHGVCGLSRLSVRSLVATAVFMATAIATVFVTRHLA